MSEKEMIKISVEEFSRIQRYMRLCDKTSVIRPPSISPNAADSRHKNS